MGALYAREYRLKWRYMYTRHIVHSLVGEAILYLQLGRYDWSTWALSILQACWLASCLLAQGIHFAVKRDNSQLFVSGN